jgi:hypothetical protein
MNRTFPSYRRLTISTVLAAGLATVVGILRPERTLFLLSAIAMLFVIWSMVITTLRRMHDADAASRGLMRGAEWGAALLVAALAIALVKALGFEQNWLAERGAGLAIGAMLFAMGNALPKLSTMTTRSSCNSIAARRFAGWTFAIAGAIYVASWAFAPVALAEIIGTVATAAATILVAGRLTACLWAPRRVE